jgi:hypothetical protein
MGKAYGKKVWLTPDGFLQPVSNGPYKSHEAICVVNTGDEDAKLAISIYFEDREPMEGFTYKCEAKRTKHIHIELLEDDKGEKVPVGVPYAIKVESSVPVVVQVSRLDTAQAEYTLMTSIAYPID